MKARNSVNVDYGYKKYKQKSSLRHGRKGNVDYSRIGKNKQYCQ